MRNIKKLLDNDEGIFVIEAPHFLHLVKSLEYDTIYHEHFSYLSIKTVNFLLKKFNLEIFDIEKIFWKFPLIASSYFASKESFLSFKDVFRPKIRGQHGAGITYLESKIVSRYNKYGSTDIDVFKNISQEP